VSTYYETVFGLGLRLLDALALELGVETEELTRHITYPTSQLRMLRYIPNDMPATKEMVGIAAHSDFECFTILLQGGPGLQVMNAEDVWIEAPPIPGCFIVNIGDIFETWSGGQFKSTQHRVINSGRERYSFPLFFGLDYHAIVEPLEKFRTPETLEKYPPMKAGDHLMRMSVNAFRYMADAKAKGDLRSRLRGARRKPVQARGPVLLLGGTRSRQPLSRLPLPLPRSGSARHGRGRDLGPIRPRAKCRDGRHAACPVGLAGSPGSGRYRAALANLARGGDRRREAPVTGTYCPGL
jgi:hypothetical protein